MQQVKKLEATMGGWFKVAPALPKNVKETLATIWPWVALVFGVLQLAAAWALWDLMNRAQPYLDLVNEYSQYFAGTDIGYSSFEKMIIYGAVVIAVIQGVILLMAFSPLKQRLQKGWDLMFLSALVGIGYSIVTLFVDGRGVGTFLFNMVIVGVVLYLLFQLKDLYKGKSAA